MIAVLVAVVLASPALVDLAWRGELRRLAFRNLTRRRGEALLVVFGATLGTAIITASLVVGDTVNAAVLGSAHRFLGPIDETVNLERRDQLAPALDALGDGSADGAAGTLARLSLTAPVARHAGEPRALDNAELVEVDFDLARAFGGDPSVTGLAEAGPTPAVGEVVVNAFAADELAVVPGDEVDAFVGGVAHTLRIRAVLPVGGIAGYGTGGRLVTPVPMFVAPGTIDAFVAAAPEASGLVPAALVLVTNGDGVIPDQDRSSPITARIKARLERAGLGVVDVTKAKQNTLLSAQRTGDSISQLYRGAGFFSVAAGVLLLVNLFVMLSEERRSELGIMRAVGMRRGHLMRSFGLEGSLYSSVASLIGGALGVGVGWAMTRISDTLVAEARGAPAFAFTLRPNSVASGIGIGLAISLVTVHGTSFAISRLNIIQAIRNIPSASVGRRSRAVLAVCSVLVAVGVGVTAAGIVRTVPVLAVAGLPLAMFAALGLVGRVRARRAITVAMCLTILLWTAGIYTILPGVMGTPNIDTFAVEGLILVAAATLLTANGDRLWAAVARRASGAGLGLAGRLSLAYPVARRGRTGMLLGMFASVVFTMTFLTVIGTVFSGQGASIVRDVRGGYDLFVDSNPSNPVSGEALRAEPDVVATAGVLRALPRFKNGREPTPKNVAVTGIDAALVDGGPPALAEWSPRFRDATEVYRALLEDPSLAIVPASFLRSGNGITGDIVDPGDSLTMVNPATGAETPFTVAGVFGRDVNGTGVMLRKDVVRDALGPLTAEVRQYVTLRPGADADAVAKRLQADLIEHGAHAVSFVAHVELLLSQNDGFFALLRGFLALGLVIGIAGMGVVMVRAVRERRREIGMLRAMGFPSRTIRRSFLLEAAFVASQGVVVGMGLAVVVSYQLVAHSTAFGDQPLPFQVPVSTLVVIAAIPLAAVLVATVAPAMQAARIKPAVALRIAE